MIYVKGIPKLNFRDTLFLFFLASFCVNSCASPQVESNFYHGLKNSSNAVSSFEKALSSSNVYVRQASADQLANLMFEGKNLSAKTEAQVRREVTGSWADAFEAVGKEPIKEKALSFLLKFRHGTDPGEARLYVLQKCAEQGGFFSETESAAIEGHFAVSRSRYGEALGFFREFREDEKWPDQIPALFIQYPALINDLGRAFQYTSSGGEGINVFLQWEKNLEVSANTVAKEREARYNLLFFSGRIARRLGRTDQAVAFFEEALPYAQDAGQANDCIWYILDLTVGAPHDIFIQRLEQTLPRWHDDSAFDDVLEKFSKELVSKQEWKKIIRIYNLIKNRRANSTAGYAWIIARTIEEGYLNEEEIQAAAQAANVPAAALDASVYMCIAYNAADTSFYYRSKSAASLGLPVLDLPAKNAKRDGKPSEVLQFLLGFFNYDAAEFAMPYIRSFEEQLTSDELRALSDALAGEGMYLQSIRLITLYINKKEHNIDRRDMELFFPRPYKDLIENFAAEYGIRPELLFALVRTESAFQSGIVSSAGAVGLTQLMPTTAQEMADRIRRAGGPNYGDKDLDLGDPALNIHIGAHYLNYLTERFDDNLLAILAYNGGMNRVRRWRSASSLPMDIFMETITVAETRLYGKKVMAAAAVYRELYYQGR